MQTQQKSQFSALIQAQSFLNDHGEHLKVINQSRLRAELDKLIDALESNRAAQAAATHDGRRRTVDKDEIRRHLCVSHLQPIAEIARVELEGRQRCAAFRCPAQRVPDAAFLARAAMVAEAAGLYRSVFIAHRLDCDFVARVRVGVAAMHRVLAERSASWALQRAATDNLARHLRRAGSVMRALDALMVRHLFYRKPELLRAWYVARHKRPPRRVLRLRLCKVA